MLAAPLIIGPITPCSISVRVQGMLTGADITLFADGSEVGVGPAKKSDDLIPLKAGITLQPGQKITALQRRDGDSSEESPLPFIVLKAPTAAQLGTIFSMAPVIECATCLWIGGIVPGAQVSLTINTDPPIIMTAGWSVAEIAVPGGIPANAAVTVQQTACGVVGPTITLPPTLRQDYEGSPPESPTPGLLFACQQEIHLYTIQPGATVHLEHNGASYSYAFGNTEALVWLNEGLDPAEALILQQEYTAGRCRLVGEPEKFPVSDQAPPPPVFTHPVCEGSSRIQLSNLVPGATLHIFGDDETTPLSIGRAYDDTSMVDLPSGWSAQYLSVRQTVCPNGPRSLPGKIKVTPVGNLQDPVIVEPLFACGTAVAVQGMLPGEVSGLTNGTYVRVISKNRGGAIGEGIANGDFFSDIDLWFALEKDDQISLESIRCGLLRSPGSFATVQAAPPDLHAPVLNPREDDLGGTVLVKDVVPGAIVEIERVPKEDLDATVSGILIGAARATRRSMPVPVAPLEPGALIRARQRLCEHRSAPSSIARIDDLPMVYQSSSTFRVCQLLGESDPAARPHRNDTGGIALLGTDLGIPVDHQGALWLFFGDGKEWSLGPITYGADADPFAWTTDDPEPDGPLLNFVTDPQDEVLHFVGDVIDTVVSTAVDLFGGDPPGPILPDRVFRRLAVDGLPELGNFEVPTGGFSYNDRVFLFVAREKVDEKMRSSHLTVSKDASPSNNFKLVSNVSSTLQGRSLAEFPGGKWLVHISPTVIKNKDWPGLPSSSGDGLLLFGTSLYHESKVYLAWTPLTPGQQPPPPQTWKFYTEPLNGQTWYTLTELQSLTTVAGTIPEPRPLPAIGDEINWQGELSVAWSPRLRRWIMGNMSADFFPLSPGEQPPGRFRTIQIVFRTARNPWGPWSTKVLVFDRDRPDCSADNLRPDGSRIWVGIPKEDQSHPGDTVPYAPYIIPRWTRFDPSIRELTVHYTLSVEPPPYCTQLMRSRLSGG